MLTLERCKAYQSCRYWITLILRSQKIKYFGWWTWKTLHFGKSILSSSSTPRNFVWNIPHPKKFRLKYQGARDVILRKSHSRPAHVFYPRKPSHFHQHGPSRRLLLLRHLSNISANFDFSPPGWTLSTAVCLTAIDDDLAEHESSRHSRGFSFLAFPSGFSSTFLVSFVPTPLSVCGLAVQLPAQVSDGLSDSVFLLRYSSPPKWATDLHLWPFNLENKKNEKRLVYRLFFVVSFLSTISGIFCSAEIFST